MKALKESLESVTKASVAMYANIRLTTASEAVVRRILAYTARPLTEFDKYEALEMLPETLQNTAIDKHHGEV